MLSETFKMKDLCEASFLLGIVSHLNRSPRLLALSQKAYIDRVLKRFVRITVHMVMLILLKR